MTKAKTLEKVEIRKPLPLYGGETLPVGTEISVTEEQETMPYGGRGRIILDTARVRHLVREEDLEYALGAH